MDYYEELDSAMDMDHRNSLVNFLEEEIQRGVEELGVLLPSDTLPLSPFFPDENRGITWSDLYLTTGVDIPLDLRAVFLAITYSNLPWNLANALALHSLVHGEQSPGYVYGRTFWEEYHRKFWERGAFASTLATDLGARDGIGDDHGFIYLHQGRLPMFSTRIMDKAMEKSLGDLDMPIYGGRFCGARGVTTTWTRMERMANGGDRSSSWEDVLMDVQVQIPLDNRVLGNRVAMVALEHMLKEKQRMSPSAALPTAVAQEGLNEILCILAREYAEFSNNQALLLGPDLATLGEQVVALQENFTDNLLEEFGSLVQEYNVEWALAAMEWSMGMKSPSQVYLAMQESIRNSPWSKSEATKERGEIHETQDA